MHEKQLFILPTAYLCAEELAHYFLIPLYKKACVNWNHISSGDSTQRPPLHPKSRKILLDTLRAMHQFHRRPCRMRHRHLAPRLQRTRSLALCQILHHHRRQPGTPPVALRTVNHHPATPSLSRCWRSIAPTFCPFLRRTTPNIHPGLRPQGCQRSGQVVRMHLFIRRALVVHLPPQRRARRRADEEHARALRGVEVLVRGFQRRGLAEVDAGAGGHDGAVVEEPADGDGVVGGVEGDDDAAEGFQGREGVQGDVVGEEGADFGEGGGVEDGGL